jgi:hypothetical protein
MVFPHNHGISKPLPMPFDPLPMVFCLPYPCMVFWPPINGILTPVSIVERPTGHGQTTGTLYHLPLRVEYTLFVIYKAGVKCYFDPMVNWPPSFSAWWSFGRNSMIKEKFENTKESLK